MTTKKVAAYVQWEGNIEAVMKNARLDSGAFEDPKLAVHWVVAQKSLENIERILEPYYET